MHLFFVVAVDLIITLSFFAILFFCEKLLGPFGGQIVFLVIGLWIGSGVLCQIRETKRKHKAITDYRKKQMMKRILLKK